MLPATLLRLLLIRAGIETNPGPYTCTTCNKNINDRRQISVLCTGCNNWLHLACTSLKSINERKKSPNWKGNCCSAQTPPRQPTIQASRRPNQPNQQRRRRPSPPPPRPSPTPPAGDTFNIMQININGMTGKHEELLHHLEKNNIHVAVVQETKYKSSTKLKPTPNYNMVRKDRTNDSGGGGVAILVHKSIPFQQVQTPTSLADDKHIEELTISVQSQDSSPLQIRNIYLPPVSSCTQGYVPKINNISDGLGNSALILGDSMPTTTFGTP